MSKISPSTVIDSVVSDFQQIGRIDAVKWLKQQQNRRWALSVAKKNLALKAPLLGGDVRLSSLSLFSLHQRRIRGGQKAETWDKWAVLRARTVKVGESFWINNKLWCVITEVFSGEKYRDTKLISFVVYQSERGQTGKPLTDIMSPLIEFDVSTDEKFDVLKQKIPIFNDQGWIRGKYSREHWLNTYSWHKLYEGTTNALDFFKSLAVLGHVWSRAPFNVRKSRDDRWGGIHQIDLKIKPPLTSEQSRDLRNVALFNLDDSALFRSLPTHYHPWYWVGQWEDRFDRYESALIYGGDLMEVFTRLDSMDRIPRTSHVT